MKMKTGDSNNILNLSDFEEEDEENGFIEPQKGTLVSSFNFNSDMAKSEDFNCPKEKTPLPDNRKGKKSANNITPPIDNEYFNRIRSYKFRESTIRIMNEMKSKHPDVNVYLSKIIDEAILYYYKNVFEKNEKGKM